MRPDTSTDALRGAAAVRMRLLRAMSSQSEASELKREVFRLQQKLDALSKNRG